jgi:hypothetical protein
VHPVWTGPGPTQLATIIDPRRVLFAFCLRRLSSKTGPAIAECSHTLGDIFIVIVCIASTTMVTKALTFHLLRRCAIDESERSLNEPWHWNNISKRWQRLKTMSRSVTTPTSDVVLDIKMNSHHEQFVDFCLSRPFPPFPPNCAQKLGGVRQYCRLRWWRAAAAGCCILHQVKRQIKMPSFSRHLFSRHLTKKNKAQRRHRKRARPVVSHRHW